MRCNLILNYLIKVSLSTTEILNMNKRNFILLSAALTLAPLSACASDSTENKALSKTHTRIAGDFSGVHHVEAADLSPAVDDNTLLFDVREAGEYAVSHLDGAVLVDPSVSADAFISQFEQDWSGKTIIFYCSVGQRSSDLANRVQAQLKSRGAAQVSNLEKGIFGWHNQSLPLSNEKGQTDLVHPYDAYWKRLVNRKEKTAYKP